MDCRSCRHPAFKRNVVGETKDTLESWRSGQADLGLCVYSESETKYVDCCLAYQ